MFKEQLNRTLLITSLVLTGLLLVHQSWDMLFDSGKPILQGNDDTGYFLWLHSSVMDGDLDMRNNLEAAPTINDTQRERWLQDEVPETKYLPNKYTIGWAVVQWPVFKASYLVADLFIDEPTGFESIFFVSIWIYQLLIAVGSLLIAYKILCRFLTEKIALRALLVTWLASPMIYYQTVRFGMIHNQAFFLTMAVIYLSLRIRETKSHLLWAILGGTCGLLIITRPTSVAYLIIPASVGIHLLVTEFKQYWKPALLGIICSLIPLLSQLAAWNEVYGTYLVFSYENEPFYWANPAILSSLFSNYHGLINWHPIYLFGLAGFIWIWKFRKDIPLSWLISTLVIVYINSSWWCWWFGSSFGNRAYEALLLFTALGIGWLFQKATSTKWQIPLTALACILILWNYAQLMLFISDAHFRENPISYWDRLTSLF